MWLPCPAEIRSCSCHQGPHLSKFSKQWRPRAKEAKKLPTVTSQLGTHLAVGRKMDLVLLCPEMWTFSRKSAYLECQLSHQTGSCNAAPSAYIVFFSLPSFLKKFFFFSILNKAVEICKYARGSSWFPQETEAARTLRTEMRKGEGLQASGVRSLQEESPVPLASCNWPRQVLGVEGPWEMAFRNRGAGHVPKSFSGQCPAPTPCWGKRAGELQQRPLSVGASANGSHTWIWPECYQVSWNKKLCPSRALLQNKSETLI